MFNPKFKYTDKMISDLGKIEKYKTILDMSDIPHYVEIEFKKQAKLKMSHFSTKIEGNPLRIEQSKEVIENKDYDIRYKSEIEIKNYWDALTFLEKQKEIKTQISEKLIKRLHAIIMNERPGKKPKESEYRKPTPPGVLFAIYDSNTGEPDYIPPEAKDLPGLMKELTYWYTNEQKLVIPIKAAIFSYQFLTIHPFDDGNGRTARAMASYMLSLSGYDMRGFYSMEEFYVEDLEGYYKNLQMNLPILYYNGRNNPENLAPWIEYFVGIMALAFEKAVDFSSSSSMQLRPLLLNLNKKDRTLINYMLREPSRRYTLKEIAELFSVTPRAVSKWAEEWVEKGYISPASGKIRITSYMLCEKYRNSI